MSFCLTIVDDIAAAAAAAAAVGKVTPMSRLAFATCRRRRDKNGKMNIIVIMP